MFFKKKIVINEGNNIIHKSSSILLDSCLRVSGDNNNVDVDHCEINNMQLTAVGNENKIMVGKAKMSNTTISVSGNNNVITFGQGATISNMEVIVNGDNHHLVFGKNTHVYGKLYIFFEDHSNGIKVGDNSTFGIAKMAVAEPNSEIVLGNDCMLANDVSIKTSDFHSIIDLKNNQKINPAGNVVIGNHVWLGESSHILKNVTIHDNSIVALGSVVTTDVPEGSIVAGNPAKVVRDNISWTRQR